MSEHVIGRADEIDPGDRLIAEVKGREICVFSVDGDLYACLNWCAHQGGPLCEGELTGTQVATFDRDSLESELRWDREDEILCCPWHGWEFDVTTGECLSDSSVRVPTYPVRVESGDVIVTV